jgi:hypothetical protein
MISALERLRALREGRSLDDLDVAGPESLPMDWRIEFEERAAILQYDGGLVREEEEIQALREINTRLRSMKKK